MRRTKLSNFVLCHKSICNFFLFKIATPASAHSVRFKIAFKLLSANFVHLHFWITGEFLKWPADKNLKFLAGNSDKNRPSIDLILTFDPVKDS